MADALLSIALDRLASITEQQIRHQVSLVVGVETEIQSLTNTLQTVRAVLADAEKRQVKDQLVKLWLGRLKDLAYEMDDVLDEWSTAILKLQIEEVENVSMPTKKEVSSCFPPCCIPFKQIVFRRHIARRIKNIKQQLDVIANERIQFNFISSDRRDQTHRVITTSVVDISEIYGRDIDEKYILNKLLCHESHELLVVSIIGMGGIGKTTLAQLIYNHLEVKSRFDERIWICVSDPFDPIRICRAIVESLQKESPNLHELEALQQKIQTCIAGKKFLLVLDDVWTEDYQLLGQLKNCLKRGAEGSSILVTTRNEGVAKMMETTYIHSLEKLSPEQCLSLFNRIAFSGRNSDKFEELGGIGGEIASKCGGLPLAIKTIGSLLRTKENKEEWESVLNSEVWRMDVIEKHLSPPLLLSYYDLPPPIRQCFSFCATFPKDHTIEKENLIRLWMAHSYLNSKSSIDMETIGQDYFHVLVGRSFFQDFEKDGDGNIIRCKMHDIIHDLAQFLTKNECLIMEVDEEEVRKYPPSEKGHHATLLGELHSSVRDVENLHTLLHWNPFTTTAAIENLFRQMACLRALELSSNILIEEVPKGLGKLMHLRYLDLSGCSSLRELPKEITNLCNLETLDVSYCEDLKTLPQGMDKLINLRHLANKGTYFWLPEGIGRLTSLRTLNQLFLRSNDENTCKIGELRNLINLRGSLEIQWLFTVEDGEEAEKAELKNKKHLHHISLTGCHRKSVIEALQPHPNLKSLQIFGYEDVEYPSWVMNACLSQLKELQLESCHGVEHIPPLGELPLLEILKIEEMPFIKYIGDEFFGSSTTMAFPKLKKLSFRYMDRWESWQVKEEQKRSSVMPCLHSLWMYECRKLEALPDCLLHKTTLQELKIDTCPLLQQRYKKEEGEDWHKISHIPNIVLIG